MGKGIVIDGHQHFWDPAQLDMPELGPEFTVMDRAYLPGDLRGELAKVGVDYTVYVQCFPQTRDSNRWMFQQANSSDFVAGVVAWVDLQNPAGVDAALDELQQESKFVGIRHIVDMESDIDWIVRDEVLDSLAILARRKIPFDMLAKPQHLKNVLKVIDQIDQLQMVIDHMAKPEIAAGVSADWEEHMAKIAQSPNVYCKVSGMITEADWRSWTPADLTPYVHKVFHMFGYDRLIYGSDWPVCRLAGEYEQVWNALNEVLGTLSDVQREAIFGANAIRFYNLKI